MMDKMFIIAEATAGYCKKLTDGGISQMQAEAMAKDLHDTLIGIIKANTGVDALKQLMGKKR